MNAFLVLEVEHILLILLLVFCLLAHSKFLAEVFIIADKNLLYLADVHGMKISLRVTLIHSLLIEEILFLEFLGIHFPTYKHEFCLLKVSGTISIDWSQTCLC